MIQPTRQDHFIVSGQTKTFEFKISGVGTLDADTVDLLISRKQGLPWHIKKTSVAGSHFDGANRLVRFTLTSSDIPPVLYGETWWYEVWRTDSSAVSVPHGVGELGLIPTNRMT